MRLCVDQEEIENKDKQLQIKKSRHCLPTSLYSTCLTRQQQNTVSLSREVYLGVYLDRRLDRRLTRRDHITKKRDEVKLRFRSIFWLMNSRSRLSLENKRFLYLSVICPIWTYAALFWGCVADADLLILQRIQDNILHIMVCTEQRSPTQSQRKKSQANHW